MGNDTQPQSEDGYVISENWGFQLNFMIPLNRDSINQCLDIAARQEEKMQIRFRARAGTQMLRADEIRLHFFTRLKGLSPLF